LPSRPVSTAVPLRQLDPSHPAAFVLWQLDRPRLLIRGDPLPSVVTRVPSFGRDGSHGLARASCAHATNSLISGLWRPRPRGTLSAPERPNGAKWHTPASKSPLFCGLLKQITVHSWHDPYRKSTKCDVKRWEAIQSQLSTAPSIGVGHPVSSPLQSTVSAALCRNRSFFS
jgi:hypothetical protein